MPGFVLEASRVQEKLSGPKKEKQCSGVEMKVTFALGTGTTVFITMTGSIVSYLQKAMARAAEIKRDLPKTEQTTLVSGSSERIMTEKILSLKTALSSYRVERANPRPDLNKMTAFVQGMERNKKRSVYHVNGGANNVRRYPWRRQKEGSRELLWSLKEDRSKISRWGSSFKSECRRRIASVFSGCAKSSRRKITFFPRWRYQGVRCDIKYQTFARQYKNVQNMHNGSRLKGFQKHSEGPSSGIHNINLD